MKTFLIFLFSFYLGAQSLGQSPNLELARVQAIRVALISYGATVQSIFLERTTLKGSEIMEAHAISVDINSLPGIHILKEEKKAGQWNVWVEFRVKEAISTLQANLEEDFENLEELRSMPPNSNRNRALEVLEGEVKEEQKALQFLVKTTSDSVSN